MDTLLILARDLLHHDDDDNDNDDGSNSIRPVEDTSGPDIVPISGTYTFHQLATIISGACGLASILIILFVVLRHATNYTSPTQQRQILRVLLLVPWVVIFSFLIVWQEGAGDYLVESLDFGCAIALSAFLLLLCDYVLENPDGFDALFGNGALQRGTFADESPKWLKRTWYLTLQFIPSSLGIWLATVITVATNTYCKTSNSTHHAHIWLTVAKILVTGVAITAVLRFYAAMKSQLAPHHVFLKLFAFKSIIGLNALQTFIISILVSHGVLHPTNHFSNDDVQTALPALLLSIEMPIFALLLLVAFLAAPYKGRGRPVYGPFVAVWQAFDVRDLLSAFVRGPMRLVRNQQRSLLRQNSIKILGAEEAQRGVVRDERTYGSSV